MTAERQNDRESGSRDSYRVAEASFEAAAGAAGGPHDRWYRIAAHLVRLRFAGPSLIAPITRSLDHLETRPRGEAELTICLWDGASTGSAAPPTPVGPAARPVAGEAWVYRDGDRQAVYRPHDRILNWLDSARSLGLYWAPDARTLPFDERVSPLRHILSWWMRSRGLEFVHAAAVGSDDGGVMLVGRNGAGKSTTALACAQSGLHFLGDNYLLVQSDPSWVYGAYRSATLHRAHLCRYPQLISPVVNPESDVDKALGFLHPTATVASAPGLPIRAIVLPNVRGGAAACSLSRVTAGEALRALAPSSIFSLPGADRTTLGTLAEMVKHIPTYALVLGGDLSCVPDLLATLASHHSIRDDAVVLR